MFLKTKNSVLRCARLAALTVAFFVAFPSGNVFAQDAGEGPFKSVSGASVQIWIDEWAPGKPGTFTMDGDTIVLGTGGWWGGAFGAFDFGNDYGAAFDMSAVAYAVCVVECDDDIPGFYIRLGDSDKDGIQKKDLKEGENMVRVEFLRKKNKKAVNPLFAFGGGSAPEARVKIKNFTFYGKNGKEVVPQLVESSN